MHIGILLRGRDIISFLLKEKRGISGTVLALFL
jgi:hypothetical protein